MRNKKREPRFLRFSKRLLVMSFIVFVVGIVALNSYESTINVACNILEKDIKTIESDIDGLDMKKLELASFSRLESVAQAKGYTYKQNTATAAVVEVPEE